MGDVLPGFFVGEGSGDVETGSVWDLCLVFNRRPDRLRSRVAAKGELGDIGRLADPGVPGLDPLTGGVCGLRLAVSPEGVPGALPLVPGDGEVVETSYANSGDLGILMGSGTLPDMFTLRLACLLAC